MPPTIFFGGNVASAQNGASVQWNPMQSGSEHLAVIVARLLLLVGMMLTTFAPLKPCWYLTLIAALSVLQCMLLHAQEHRWKIKSNQPHPLQNIDLALQALRFRAIRHRAQDEACVRAAALLCSTDDRRQILMTSRR